MTFLLRTARCDDNFDVPRLPAEALPMTIDTLSVYRRSLFFVPAYHKRFLSLIQEIKVLNALDLSPLCKESAAECVRTKLFFDNLLVFVLDRKY